MASVYLVGSHYGSFYFNTSKEADRCRPGDELPESVERRDAAEECERLQKEAEDMERSMFAARTLLEELLDVCPLEIVEQTDAGRKANKFIAEHPMSPATAADRDGGRSYGL